MSRIRRKKKYASVGVCGHVHSGKSCFLGKLIYLLGGVDTRSIDRYERESKERNCYHNDLSKFSWILDRFASERSIGHTNDWSAWFMESMKMEITLIDTPGRVEYFKNTLTGISMSDHICIVVDPRNGPFEASIKKGGLVNDLLNIVWINGIKSIMFLITRMDCINYDEERFDYVSKKIKDLLSVHFREQIEDIPIIPISTKNEDNIISLKKETPWWKNKKTNHGGKTVLEVFDSYLPQQAEILEEYYKERADLPFRMSISDTYKIGGIGTCSVGRVCCGSVFPEKEVWFSKKDSSSFRVRSIERHHYPLGEKVFGGRVISLNLTPAFLTNISKRDIKRGGIISGEEPMKVSTFTAEVTILKDGVSIKAGYSPIMDCHAEHIPCRWEKIVSKWKGGIDIIDEKKNETINFPEDLKSGESGMVILKPKKNISLEEFEFCPRLGSILFRDNGRLIACGRVINIFEKNV